MFMEYVANSDGMMMNNMDGHMTGMMGGMLLFHLLLVLLTILLIVLGVMAIIILYRKHFKRNDRVGKDKK